jgi:hypothetical protein
MDDTRRQFVLQLTQPMLREFNKTIIEMRERGQTEAEIADMLERIEVENRGKLDDWILDVMMSELRLAASNQSRP